jgi:hypothetical protein
MVGICICMIELNFEGQNENKLEVNSNRKIITRNATKHQLVITFLFDVEILRSSHC